MKKAAFFSVPTILLLAVSFMAFKPQTHSKPSDFIMIRAIEELKMDGYVNIVVSNAEQKVKTVTAWQSETRSYGYNGTTILATIQEYYDQGYELIESNSGGGDEKGLIITNYILRKE